MKVTLKDRLNTFREGGVPQGYIKTSDGVFPDDWKISQLQEVVRIFRGASPRPKGDPRYYGGEIPRALIEDVTRDGKYVYPSIDSLTEEGAKKSRLLPKNSVILSCSGTRVAIPGILGKPACIHDGFFGFDDYKGLVPEYLYYFFWLLHDKIQSSATKGGVFNNLTTKIMKEMYVQFPDIAEQEKIIDVINTWDMAIELKEKLIEQKKEQKKGLMQKLLTNDVRLPRFKGEWKYVKLNEILRVRNERSVVSENLPLYSLTIEDGVTEKTDRYNREFLVKSDNKKYKITRNNDIVYNPSNLRFGAIALNNIKKPVLLSPIYEVLYIKKSEMWDINFIAQILTSDRQIRIFSSKAEGTLVERMAVKIGAFLNTEILVPLDIDEQQSISKILGVIDKEIVLLQEEIYSLKKQKKGLMQLLLSGKVRVQV